MTKDDIICMARECDLGRVCGPLDTLLDYEWEALHRFANLVAEREREECAKLADKQLRNTAALMSNPPKSSAAWEIAIAIRARGTT